MEKENFVEGRETYFQRYCLIIFKHSVYNNNNNKNISGKTKKHKSIAHLKEQN